MTELNDLTMLTAIRRCSETENYKVGIFVKTKKMADDAYEDAIGFIKEDEDEMNAIHRCTKNLNASIQFRNGSYIRFLSPSENARGFAFNEVLCSSDIDSDTMRRVIIPTEKINTANNDFMNRTWDQIHEIVYGDWVNKPEYWWLRAPTTQTLPTFYN